MKIEVLTVGMFAMNCYLIIDTTTSEAIFIDPGDEAERLIKKAEAEEVEVKFIVNTHCHIDHIAEVHKIQDHFNIPFFIHKNEVEMLNILPEQANMFGLENPKIPKVTSYITEGDPIKFGTITGKVLNTPGHSPGGISLLFDNHVFVGDSLFMDSIGRTDLYMANYEQLMESIKTKLLRLEDDVEVLPGHGPATTIGREKRYNPFLQEM
jgi:glyoxylase-like metal-dependent hydrolase (beta-lactamase superfamily II)